MPILGALANPKIGEREVLEAMLDRDADMVTSRTGLVLIGDKGFSGCGLKQLLTERRPDLLRPARKKEKEQNEIEDQARWIVHRTRSSLLISG